MPAPEYDPELPLQAHVTNLDASPYVGRLAICRVLHGTIRQGQQVAWCRRDGSIQKVKISELYLTEALDRVQADSAGPGDIVAIAGVPTERLVRGGLCVVPEGRGVFPNLTVVENLKMASFSGTGYTEILEKSFQLFPRLAERRGQLAGKLSGGEQQQLAIARALMARPKLLMLDEPSLGLAPLVIDEMFAWLSELHEAGTTILLIEQNATRTIEVADRTYVLNKGKVAREIEDSEAAADTNLLETYLGVASERPS